MKQIKVYCDRYGKVTIDDPNILLSQEHNSIDIVVSMAGLGLTSYYKRVEFLVGNDKSGGYLPTTNVTGDSFTITLTEEYLKKGYLRFQPIAYLEVDGVTTKKIKWQVIELKVKFSLDIMETTVNVTPNQAELINQRITALQSYDIGYGDGTVEQKFFSIDAFLEEISIPRYDDIVFEFTPTRVNPTISKPDYDSTNIGLLFPQNDLTEAIFITCQIPHKWKVGTTIYPHVHVVQSRNEQATFRMEYKWYNIGDTIPASWSTYNMTTYATAYSSGSISQIIHGSTGISGVGKDISSILKIKLFRTDNVYVGDILADQFDIHIEVDGFGSETQFSKE